MTSPAWQTDNQTRQTLSRVAPFTYTMSTGDTSTWREVFTVAGRMSEGQKVSFTVDLADAYVAFDTAIASAPSSFAAGAIIQAMLVPAGTGFSEENIFIGTRIIMVNATTTNARIRGIVEGK